MQFTIDNHDFFLGNYKAPRHLPQISLRKSEGKGSVTIDGNKDAQLQGQTYIVSPIEVTLNENVVETNISELTEFRGEMLCRWS